MAAKKEYRAIVDKIIANGKHGPYAVARCEEFESITFSLDVKVWQEENWPEPGTFVMLSKVREKRAGWRADHGRFVSPEDKQPETSKKRN